MSKFQTLITAIATQHGLDLSLQYAHLTLTMPGYQQLVIEKVGKHHVNVMHIASDDLYDPLFQFDTDGDTWVPVEQRMALFGGRINLVKSQAQTRDIMSFCNESWAENLGEQGWLTRGVVKSLLNARPGTAWLLKETGEVEQILVVTPTLSSTAIYELLECDIMEFVAQRNGDYSFAFIGDEEGKMVDEPGHNRLATRMTGLYHYGDWFAGNCILVADDLLQK